MHELDGVWRWMNTQGEGSFKGVRVSAWFHVQDGIVGNETPYTVSYLAPYMGKPIEELLQDRLTMQTPGILMKLTLDESGQHGEPVIY